jgi:acetyl-CoA carboxylase / biotin carboxylase 1
MAPAGVNGVKGTKPLTNGTPSSWQAKHDVADHFIGANKLSKAAPSKVKDFVQSHDGHTVITSVSPRCQTKIHCLCAVEN